MSFSAMTAFYQDQISEHTDRPVSDEMIEEVEAILENYCTQVEQTYGVNMVFDIRIVEADSENPQRLRYRVTPDSDLDGTLLAIVVENEARVAPVSFRLQ